MGQSFQPTTPNELPPIFLLQIVRPDGVVARLPGGGALEAELVDHLTAYVLKHRIALFVPIWRVRGALKRGIHEAIRALKTQSVQAL